MDFDPDPSQARRRDVLRTVLAPFVRSDDQLADRHDADLDAAVASEPELTGAGLSLLDRVLLVEEAARLGAPVDATATLLLRPLVASEVVGPIAIRTAAGDRPVRFGAGATSVVDVTGALPTVAAVTGFDPVASGAAAGYGRVRLGVSSPLGWTASLPPLALVQLGRAAEIAGVAMGAVGDVAAYLGERQQFGRTLSTFQGLQHRLAELAVDAHGASVSARTAAHVGTGTRAVGAAAYAIDVAARAVPELHQLSGARGFTFESGLPARTMRLLATRLELTASGVSPEAFATATWGD
jgi:alkylation response protein AidB-like acyl-CoA dehydrogenase